MIAPIDWLTTARVALKSCELKERVTTPLVTSNESLFRLYLCDVGMYSIQSNLTSNVFASSLYGEFAGYFYENYLATELLAREYKLFYWKGKRASELEFILDIGSRIIPIDAKKNKRTGKRLINLRKNLLRK